MNYYPHHIGDFDKATRHLSRIERSVYRDMIEIYYDTESQLTLDIKSLCRIVLAKTNEELTAVEQVLNEFFIKTENGFFHVRCDEEIKRYRGNISQKSMAGIASGLSRGVKNKPILNGCSTDDGRMLNKRGTNQNQNHNYIIDKKTVKQKTKETSTPDKFEVTQEMFSWAIEQGLLETRIKPETENFLDRCRAKDIKYLNWVAAWRTWIRNAVKFTKVTA